jgi:hypothetical protein
MGKNKVECWERGGSHSGYLRQLVEDGDYVENEVVIPMSDF